ncbi:MAG TPA: shikimate dehydrogenase [Saprospiraceae bacterium]|nr:shikimate dehydrogenase [Saprospiraceae bacterium]HNT20592.1 shikimate dehydrogenase [Saprospiraceae bacterium]
MRKFGLIGYPLTHSFSKKYFADKFIREKIEDAVYELYPIPQIEEFPALVAGIGPGLMGLNVTIPYKRSVIPFLDALSPAARAIGAVNTIHFVNGLTTGHNTDATGFEESLRSWYDAGTGRALVLGDGGSAQAVKYVLQKLGIPFHTVSRQKKEGTLSYEELDHTRVGNCTLIVNTTPLGMYPDVKSCPPIDYSALGKGHFLYDLVYNPEKTAFLAKGEARGCRTMNGLDMLHRQAEAAWHIWNS